MEFINPFEKYSAEVSSGFFFYFPFVIIGFICLFIYLFNFGGPPKSLGRGLLSLCIKTALYRRLGRDESPTVDSVCVRAHLRYWCESYCRLRLCAHLTYGAVGVVRSIAFVCMRVRVTGWYSFAVSVIFSCYSGKQVQCRFYRESVSANSC